ncbi:ATP12 family chaperone protein [Sulfitobacter sp. S190]|uniref:ATP12 family chaperone protein n=1 Tax=Sulfitobacter sp. S190 TaxID=2867022 RepID=UPI0021A85045|nr:ATP12 family protein [Sulfitobacter sp. S190]UWR22998.1 ATPase [Sulfitobacter sp. S190]
MSDWKAKRFWKEATVEQIDEAWTVRLDGRPVKTPAKRALLVPTRPLATAIAEEWQAQEGEIRPHTMPVTKTANAAIDKVAVQHAEVADMLAAYGDSDLLCYRADSPAALVERQSAQWDPLLDWAHDALGARLLPRAGIMHRPQDPQALAILSRETHALDAFRLAAFHDLVSLSGSLVIGFAAARDARPAEALWELSRLDENWQAEQWGDDEEALAQAEIKRAAFLHAKRMFALAEGTVA